MARTDAFRGNVEYQWMVGGQFVGHPHVGKYTVRLTGLRTGELHFINDIPAE